MKLVLTLLALLLPTLPARADITSNAKAFDAACATFRRAVELAPTDSKASASAALESAAAFRELADSGINNHKLQTNLGNSYLIGGDVGRAVLAYRRAESINPKDPRAQAGLAAARARVGVSIEPTAENRLQSALLSWRGHISRNTMLTILLSTYIAGWAIAIVVQASSLHLPLLPSLHTRASRARCRIAGVVLGLAALTSGALLALDDYTLKHSGDAVITAQSTIGRTGPGDSLYEPSFKDALRPGIECRILEPRGTWTNIKLADGRETWVPSSSLERVTAF
jgi:tetratricopeptide (TPR) repeat protein